MARRATNKAATRPSPPIVRAAPSSVPSASTTPTSSSYTSEIDGEGDVDDAPPDPNQLSLASLSLAGNRSSSSGSSSKNNPVRRPAKLKSPPHPKPFPLLDLPSELRLKIYGCYFDSVPRVLDLDPDNQKRVRPLFQLLRTCRLVREEAAHLFWSTHTPRIFPTHPGRFFKTKKPLLARMRPHQRSSLTSLELRLGPGWSSPPRGWVVNDALGLRDCLRVRKVVVFIECDPSDGIFTGFRLADGFYEGFCMNLLTKVLDQLPNADVIEFDAWPSVKKSGAMVRALLDLVHARSGLSIRWGAERGWTDDEEEEEQIPVDIKGLLDTATSSVSFAGYGSQSIMVTV